MFESSDIEFVKNGKSFNNNDDIAVNNNYELKFPYSIKSVDPAIDGKLLRDFTGKFSLFVA